MVSNLHAQRTQVTAQQDALAQRASELEHTLAELQQSGQEREQLSQSIRELASPVLPVFEGILVMPLIDTRVARVLLHATQAIKLLGARTILVGLRPELAQTITELGLDIRSLVTHADL